VVFGFVKIDSATSPVYGGFRGIVFAKKNDFFMAG
jgi:hypothetical protein